MDWDKMRDLYPQAYSKLRTFCWNYQQLEIERVSFAYSVCTIQGFFSGLSVYVEMHHKTEGWNPKINHIETTHCYANLLNAYEFGFETALGLLENRLAGIRKSVDGKDLHFQLMDFMPEKQKRSYNVFSSTLRSLRLNKVKSVIFIEGFDWTKEDGEIYYTPSGAEKVKQYLIKLK